MAKLTVNAIKKIGLDPKTVLASAAAGGDSVDASDNLFLYVKNTDATPATITIKAPTGVVDAQAPPYGAQDIGDIAVVVAATTGEAFITLPIGYSQKQSFAWEYTSVTALSIGVFSLAPNS
jgi:hypothetical protein